MKTQASKWEHYWQLLAYLDKDVKKALMDRLARSIQEENAQKHNRMEEAFGAWEGKESANEVIYEIRKSRTFNRKTEEL